MAIFGQVRGGFANAIPQVSNRAIRKSKERDLLDSGPVWATQSADHCRNEPRPDDQHAGGKPLPFVEFR
jgi:hypothetical protein